MQLSMRICVHREFHAFLQLCDSGTARVEMSFASAKPHPHFERDIQMNEMYMTDYIMFPILGLFGLIHIMYTL